MLLIVNIYDGFMEGLEGKEESSFLQFPEADGNYTDQVGLGIFFE